MAFTYPVTLNLAGRRCLVVGGGAVASRKVASLLEEKAQVVVISPALCPELAARQAEFLWFATPYETGQVAELLGSCFLVIAATDQREVNRQVAEDCAARNILVNVIDCREESSFTVNAAVKRGDLLLAVSTNGISPALSKAIREQLECSYGEEYGALLRILAEARQEAMQTIQDGQKRRAFLQQVTQMELLPLLKEESEEAVRKRVKSCLSSYWD